MDFFDVYKMMEIHHPRKYLVTPLIIILMFSKKKKDKYYSDFKH